RKRHANEHRHAASLDVPVTHPLASVFRPPQLDEPAKRALTFDVALAHASELETSHTHGAPRVGQQVAIPIGARVAAEPEHAVLIRGPEAHAMRAPGPAAARDDLDLLGLAEGDGDVARRRG